MKVSKELQDQVRNAPNVKEVYFSQDGHHYFAKHRVTVHEDNSYGASAGQKEVDTLPGVKDSILKVKVGKDIIDKKVHVSYIPIAETMSREDILKAVPVLPQLSEAEETEILHQAADIYRKRGIEMYTKKEKK